MSAKRRSSGKFAPPVVKSSIRAPKTTIDESKTAVSATDALQATVKADAIEISSDEDSEEDVSDQEMEPPHPKANEPVNGQEDTAAATENQTQQQKTATAAGAAESDDEAGSPTFGELLRGTIDVPAILSQQGESNKAIVPRKNLAVPTSLSSLSTVLTQALKTEDTDLLESCLQATNLETIRQTIERLDSSLAGILLTKLAARFHRRPGRAGNLMVWVKWTLVAHGGALAVQPKVLDRLVALQKVLNERSRGLPSLLALKGKLDMLEAQMYMRKSRPRRRSGANHVEDGDNEGEEEEDNEEEDAIYVEGDEGANVGMVNGTGSGITGDEDEAEVPMTNGFVGDSDDDDDEDEALDVEDDISEGEEVDDEDNVDYDDLEDSEDDEDSDAEAAPPAKVQKTASSFAKRK